MKAWPAAVTAGASGSPGVHGFDDQAHLLHRDLPGCRHLRLHQRAHFCIGQRSGQVFLQDFRFRQFDVSQLRAATGGVRLGRIAALAYLLLLALRHAASAFNFSLFGGEDGVLHLLVSLRVLLLFAE